VHRSAAVRNTPRPFDFAFDAVHSLSPSARHARLTFLAIGDSKVVQEAGIRTEMN
jgi:hypothetical protein